MIYEDFHSGKTHFSFCRPRVYRICLFWGARDPPEILAEWSFTFIQEFQEIPPEDLAQSIKGMLDPMLQKAKMPGPMKRTYKKMISKMAGQMVKKKR